jgi:tRNA G10  N-methylase Trm11
MASLRYNCGAMIYGFVFGRTPLLSRAELLHVLEVWDFSHTEVAAGESFLLLQFQRDPASLFERLGGTVKVVRVEDELMLNELPDGKMSFGVSLYGGGNAKARRSIEISIKQRLRDRGRNSRFVMSAELALSSGTVIRERLLEKGFEWDRFYATGETYEGRTVWVQDIEAWAARDQERPFRDARVGMLPPKLARILVNLGVSAVPERARGPVYDPFCGTGTVLQEALLSHYEAAGGDIDPRMVDYTTKNMTWLQNASQGLPLLREVAQRDAREAPTYPLEAVVTEGYLGPPRETAPVSQELEALNEELKALYETSFEAFRAALEPGKRLIVCFPTLQGKPLPFVDAWVPGGYNRLGSYDYRRDDQIVGRQITIYQRA